MKEWEKNIRKVIPYTPGEQPKDKNVIKLNTNENPYPPSPKIKKILQDMSIEGYRLYPDPLATDLVSKIAEEYKVNCNQVFPGVGSDDVLAMIFLTFFNSEKPILFPDITYSFYSVWAEVYNVPYKRPKLDENFKMIAKDYYEPNGGVLIANPNAPTSIYQDLEFIEDILVHNQDVIVVVDEAYIDFGGRSSIELLSKYENLIVVQTFSKSRAMAGLRIGYAIASEKIIKALNNVKYSINSYTMNKPSIELGVGTLESKEYYMGITNKILDTRKRTVTELEKIGFKVLPTGANFVFVTHKKFLAKVIFQELKAKKIYVRYFEQERIDNYLRITIGTDDEMDVLLKFLKKYQI